MRTTNLAGAGLLTIAITVAACVLPDAPATDSVDDTASRVSNITDPGRGAELPPSAEPASDSAMAACAAATATCREAAPPHDYTINAGVFWACGACDQCVARTALYRSQYYTYCWQVTPLQVELWLKPKFP